MSWVVLGLVIGRVWKGNCGLVGIAITVVADMVKLFWKLLLLKNWA